MKINTEPSRKVAMATPEYHGYDIQKNLGIFIFSRDTLRNESVRGNSLFLVLERTS